MNRVKCFFDKQKEMFCLLQEVLSAWMNKTGRDGHTQSGTVCGQDPESVAPSKFLVHL